MKNYNNVLYVMLTACLGVALLGCGPAKPKGLATIRPLQVKVTNGTTPVEGVKVSLFSTALPNGVVVFADTDASGVAVFHTVAGTWKAQGAPEGDYKVTLAKYANLEYTLKDEKRENASTAEIQKYDTEYNAKVIEIEKIVPVVCRGADKTPVSVKVSAETSSFDVDLSKYK